MTFLIIFKLHFYRSLVKINKRWRGRRQCGITHTLEPCSWNNFILFELAVFFLIRRKHTFHILVLVNKQKFPIELLLGLSLYNEMCNRFPLVPVCCNTASLSTYEPLTTWRLKSSFLVQLVAYNHKNKNYTCVICRRFPHKHP